MMCGGKQGGGRLSIFGRLWLGVTEVGELGLENSVCDLQVVKQRAYDGLA